MTKRTDPFYLSAIWRQLRFRVLCRDRFRCVICGADVNGKNAARVDHIKPRRTHPHLALDLRNLRTLCASCDNQSHREKATGALARQEKFRTRGCDADGWPRQTIVR